MTAPLLCPLLGERAPVFGTAWPPWGCCPPLNTAAPSPCLHPPRPGEVARNPNPLALGCWGWGGPSDPGARAGWLSLSPTPARPLSLCAHWCLCWMFWSPRHLLEPSPLLQQALWVAPRETSPPPRPRPQGPSRREGWAGRARGLPSRHPPGGGARATITGKAKAVVSLLSKYLWKPQEAAGWSAGPPRSPRPAAARRPPARAAPAPARGPPIWAGRGPCTQRRFVVRIIDGAQSAPSASLLDGPLQPSRV